MLWVALLISASSSTRMTWTATEAVERTVPTPAQCGQTTRRAFEHAGADALARHFQQAEMRDAADLDARAVVLERFLEAALDGPVVAALLHVDEIDHDQAGEIAQAQLARDFVGGLEIGPQRGVLDIVLAGRAAGVDVDRDQRLGLVDDEIAAGFQRHLVVEQRVELGFRAPFGEDRLRIAIRLRRS